MRLRLFTITAFAFSLLVVPAVTQAAPPTNFLDVSRSHEHFLSIQYFAAQGMISGYSDQTFKSENPINRAEALKLILVTSKIPLIDQPPSLPMPDVQPGDWFFPYVATAHDLKIVSGNAGAGTFTPGRQVNRAEFFKILFAANKVDLSPRQEQESSPYPDVPREAWFFPSLAYAAQAGIIEADPSGRLLPGQSMNRGEVVEALYRFTLVKNGKDNQFLLDRTEDNLSQIEVYVAASRVDLAKRASRLAVDLTQAALRNAPSNRVVLGAAKLARAYDFLVEAYRLGLERKFTQAADLANQAIAKATEAWESNHATQPVAKHIKTRAREILVQVGGQEKPVEP